MSVTEDADAQNLGDGLFARIATDKGDIVVRLEYQKTPLTVCNFVALAEGKMTNLRGKRFYDGLTFHRVIDNFMIQGGCPLGNGTGGPGYKFPDEIDPTLKHDKPGILSMANSGPDTNGSQFFITTVPTPHLDGVHTVFGQVVHGQNVVNTISKVKVDKDNKPIEKVTVKSVTIIRNGKAASNFKADQETFDKLQRDATSRNQRLLESQRQEALAKIAKDYPNAQRTTSGIRYIIQKAGTGPKPAKGNSVKANYKIKLLDGKVLDDSVLRGGPLDFEVGTGRILAGLDESLMDMQVGEKRLAIIPPEKAYGDRSPGGGVPPNSFLVFELELVSIK